VKIYDVVEEKSKFYIVTEYIIFVIINILYRLLYPLNISKVVKDLEDGKHEGKKWLKVDIFKTLMRQMIKALAYLHKK